MDRPKQKRVWIDQDVIDSPPYILDFSLWLTQISYIPTHAVIILPLMLASLKKVV